MARQGGAPAPARDAPGTVARDAPGTVARDVAGTVVRDVPGTAVREPPEMVVRDVPGTVVRDVPGTVMRDVPGTVAREVPGTVARDVAGTVVRDVPGMAVRDGPGLVVLGHGTPGLGKQGHLYTPGVSAERAGSRALHLQLLTLPPGEVGRAHMHAAHETAIYVLTGVSGVWWGEALEHHETAAAGAFVYIGAGVPHLPYNASGTDTCTAVIARTDPNEQESVVLLPALEAAWRARENRAG